MQNKLCELEVITMSKENPKKLDNMQIEKVSGGSLEFDGKGGFRVFNAITKEDFGTYKNYDEAVKVAKKHKISAMGTWGDKEVPLGLSETGFNRETVRVEEDRTHKANSVFGSGSFDIK